MITLHDSSKEFTSALALETFLSRRMLSLLRTLFFTGTVLSGTAGLVALYGLKQDTIGYLFVGACLIFLGLWIEQLMLFAYHNSFFFRGLNSIIGLDEAKITSATYEAAKAVLKDPDDLTFAFSTSPFGTQVLLRAGIAPEAVDAFLQGPRTKYSAHSLVLEEDKVFTLMKLGIYLLKQDLGFKELIVRQGVKEETFIGALRWVVGSYHQDKRLSRWWSKDNLSRTKGIGREWSYGTPYVLQKFSRDIRTSAVFSTLTENAAYAGEKIGEIESTLARGKSANILLIGEPGVGKIDLVMEIGRRIATGTSLDAIAGRAIITLDTNRLFATHRDKQSLEMTIITLFNEAVHAGNLIIVIENLSTVIKEAEAMGVFLPELLDQYLSSPHLNIIATDTPGAYHTFLEPLGAFTRRFAEVLIDTPDQSATIRVLQNIALTHEIKYRTIFTYGALEAIVSAADRYIVEGVMPDKAIELLVTVAAESMRQNKGVVDASFVFAIVSEKTGIPSGPISDTERDLLLNLEDKLHAQVIGQQRALNAIARTMRRARAGIQAADKPIGSFLFLGPTGVGKTETAKALARIFFGGEGKMHRLDMSEFSGADALVRLLGNGEGSGTLPDMLREHPYSVLLLDEFEKASRPVHDLFLQILDEGIFTDARGERVNARNTIIIATSNAGSGLIMRTVEQRKELAHLTQEIIDAIIREGIFRPELINRFDSTIIFEPLTISEQGQIATLMLGSLHERIKDQGYTLGVSQDLIDVLVQKGYNPEFGARPMQRVLQDVVEEKVAQKIISGEVKKGDTILLTKNDFTESELAVL